MAVPFIKIEGDRADLETQIVSIIPGTRLELIRDPLHYIIWPMVGARSLGHFDNRELYSWRGRFFSKRMYGHVAPNIYKLQDSTLLLRDEPIGTVVSDVEELLSIRNNGWTIVYLEETNKRYQAIMIRK